MKTAAAKTEKTAEMDPGLEKRLVPNQEYARRIGVTSRTLFNYVARGILPQPHIINGRKFWDPLVLPRRDVGRT